MARYVQLDGGSNYVNTIRLDTDPAQFPLPPGHTLVDADTYGSTPSLPIPTDEDRIDAAFPGTDVAQVIFEGFFEVINRVITLEGGATITRAQLRDWFKVKLPP